jgi:hypothetical protein
MGNEYCPKTSACIASTFESLISVPPERRYAPFRRVATPSSRLNYRQDAVCGVRKTTSWVPKALDMAAAVPDNKTRRLAASLSTTFN